MSIREKCNRVGHMSAEGGAAGEYVHEERCSLWTEDRATCPRPACWDLMTCAEAAAQFRRPDESEPGSVGHIVWDESGEASDVVTPPERSTS